MKAIPEGFVRGFHQVSKAWYCKSSLDIEGMLDIFSVGLYMPGGGGTLGEFSVCWEQLDTTPSARLRVYDESWEVLLEYFSDMLQAMADLKGKTPTPAEFNAMLLRCGMQDLTVLVRPF